MCVCVCVCVKFDNTAARAAGGGGGGREAAVYQTPSLLHCCVQQPHPFRLVTLSSSSLPSPALTLSSSRACLLLGSRCSTCLKSPAAPSSSFLWMRAVPRLSRALTWPHTVLAGKLREELGRESGKSIGTYCTARNTQAVLRVHKPQGAKPKGAGALQRLENQNRPRLSTHRCH